MRIGLVLEQFDPRRGGVEQWTHQCVQRLLAAGHEVHIVAQRFGESQLAKGIIAHPVQPHRTRCARAETIERMLRRMRLDVVHDMGVGWYCDVFQPHGGSFTAAVEQNLLLSPAWLRPWKRHISKWLPRHRDYVKLATRQYAARDQIVIALSEMVQRHLHLYHAVPPERMRLVYNGVDTRRFSPAHRLEHRAPVRARLGLKDEVLFLMVAHNFRLKGVPTALEAIARLAGSSRAASNRGAHLAVIGGKQIAPYEGMARRLGIGDRVSFLGTLDDPIPYYAAADVYVQPTFYDPCSLVVLEALASGLPVITSRFNGAAELMTPDRHGFVLDDPADPQPLAARMESLLDERLQRQMGDAARQLSLSHTFQQNIDRLLEIYQEVLASRQPTTRRIRPAATIHRLAG